MSDEVVLTGPIKIVRAFQPGDVVIIECDRTLGEQERLHLKNLIDSLKQRLSITLIVLDKGMRVVAREEPAA